MSKSKTSSKSMRGVEVLNIYVKNSLFETFSMPPGPTKSRPQPIIDLQLNVWNSLIKNELYEATLAIHVVAKQDGNCLWKIQLQQAGLYRIRGLTEIEKSHILNCQCMTQLFPYAAAEVNRLATNAGFSTVYLSAINFEQVYREQGNQEATASSVTPLASVIKKDAPSTANWRPSPITLTTIETPIGSGAKASDKKSTEKNPRDKKSGTRLH